MLKLPDRALPLTPAELLHALNAAGEEDTRWEAKGAGADKKKTQVAVAGLANRDGGHFVLGVERVRGEWRFAPLEPVADGEPGRWLADQIADGLKPVPQVDTQVVEVDAAGRWVAVVRVDPLRRDLAVLSDGTVLYREHGRTSRIQDGATLTALVLKRAGVGLPANLDTALSADDLAVEVERAGDAGLARLPALLSRVETNVERAVQFGPDPQAALDQLTAVAAVIAASSADTYALERAVRSHHRVFDRIQAVRGPVNARHDLELYRVLRPNVLALGGLLVRLEQWEAARLLAAHRGPLLGRHQRSWLLYIENAQMSVSAGNLQTRRHSITAGRETTARLAALTPDGADEHRALDSVLSFDVIANVVELDEAQGAGYHGEVWPDFALFDATAARPMIERLLLDDEVRAGVLPLRDQREAGELLVRLDTCAGAVAPEQRMWHGAFTPQARQGLTAIGL